MVGKTLFYILGRADVEAFVALTLQDVYKIHLIIIALRRIKLCRTSPTSPRLRRTLLRLYDKTARIERLCVLWHAVLALRSFSEAVEVSGNDPESRKWCTDDSTRLRVFFFV